MITEREHDTLAALHARHDALGDREERARAIMRRHATRADRLEREARDLLAIAERARERADRAHAWALEAADAQFEVEDRMRTIWPDPDKESSPGRLTGFFHTGKPCSDCIDGWCQMNCGPRQEPDPDRLREDRDERRRIGRD